MLGKGVKFSIWDKDKHDLQMSRNRAIVIDKKLNIFQEFYFYICISWKEQPGFWEIKTPSLFCLFHLFSQCLLLAESMRCHLTKKNHCWFSVNSITECLQMYLKCDFKAKTIGKWPVHDLSWSVFSLALKSSLLYHA